MACNSRACTLHHILLTWDGNCAMGCQFWNLSLKVSRNMWRNGIYIQLGLKSYCCSVLPILDTSYWDLMDIYDIYIHHHSCHYLCYYFRARNQRTSNGRSGEDVGRKRSQLQVLAEKFSLWRRSTTTKDSIKLSLLCCIICNIGVLTKEV